jgi:hypothetical protein
MWTKLRRVRGRRFRASLRHDLLEWKHHSCLPVQSSSANNEKAETIKNDITARTRRGLPQRVCKYAKT